MEILWNNYEKKKKGKTKFCDLGYMQVVNVATFWSFNKTVESPFEVEPPKVGRVLTFLEQKPYVSPPPRNKHTSRNPAHVHVRTSVFTSYTCIFWMTTVVGSKTRIPTVKDTRFVTGARDVIQNDGSRAFTKESRLESICCSTKPKGPTDYVGISQFKPVIADSSPFSIVEYLNPTLLLEWYHRQDEHLKTEQYSTFVWNRC